MHQEWCTSSEEKTLEKLGVFLDRQSPRECHDKTAMNPLYNLQTWRKINKFIIYEHNIYVWLCYISCFFIHYMYYQYIYILIYYMCVYVITYLSLSRSPLAQAVGKMLPHSSNGQRSWQAICQGEASVVDSPRRHLNGWHLCVWAVEHPHQSDMWEHQGRDLKAGKHGKKSPKYFHSNDETSNVLFLGIFFWGFLRHLLTLSPEKSDRTTVEGGQSQAVTSCCRSNLCQTP